MSVLFVSDLHLGHRSILKHGTEPGAAPRGGTTVDEHDDWVIRCLFSAKPDKRTLWYFLGDVAMDTKKLALLDQVPGRKVLVAGNHDLLDTGLYLKHFERVMGGFKKYGMWITHMPLHPTELRGKPNIHGHCHHNPLHADSRYFNACIEWLPNNRPVSLDWLRSNWEALR